MPIKIISFDMEGTLIDHSFSKQIWENDIPALYAMSRGIHLDDARRKVIEEYDTIGEGRLEWYDVGYWWKRLDLDGDWRKLLKDRKTSCIIYREVNEVLNRLFKKYPLVISSNTMRTFLEIQLQCFPPFFTRVFSAPSDFGIVKSSPEFFLRVCNELCITPSELVHVGDHHRFDYLAAKGLGVKAYYLDRSRVLNGPDIVHDLTEFEKCLKEP